MIVVMKMNMTYQVTLLKRYAEKRMLIIIALTLPSFVLLITLVLIAKTIIIDVCATVITVNEAKKLVTSLQKMHDDLD